MHNNIAKKSRKISNNVLKDYAESIIRMLYEFYSGQNAKKPRSIYATFIVEGILKATKESIVNGHQREDEDVHPQGSAYKSSSMPQGEDSRDDIVFQTITMAREEHLEGKTWREQCGIRLSNHGFR